MPTYRLYFLSPHNGHIERFDEFEAADDDAALELACRKEGASPLELWQGHRKVATIEANDPAARIVAHWRDRETTAGSLSEPAK